MNVKQGVIGGASVALFASLMIGVNAESFWVPFLTTLVFSMVCAGAVTWLLVAARRGRGVSSSGTGSRL